MYQHRAFKNLLKIRDSDPWDGKNMLSIEAKNKEQRHPESLLLLQAQLQVKLDQKVQGAQQWENRLLLRVDDRVEDKRAESKENQKEENRKDTKIKKGSC